MSFSIAITRHTVIMVELTNTHQRKEEPVIDFDKLMEEREPKLQG